MSERSKVPTAKILDAQGNELMAVRKIEQDGSTLVITEGKGGGTGVAFDHDAVGLSGSSGVRSSANLALRMLSGPSQVKACPLRPDRVGSTQSNISIPRSTAPTISSGLPTPIR